jgi:hypothetical protein
MKMFMAIMINVFSIPFLLMGIVTRLVVDGLQMGYRAGFKLDVWATTKVNDALTQPVKIIKK